ncbi:centrosomal protein of 68 kDa isoform X2 [Pimephales promelas]|uniref:centrosomal protein of 68 kDa isoform X2 n=1 Tax=Pimephales promelas TaxID=90988 RepID=UPI001955DF36|nr:centrosomal protein of 68 kDa isoform X2 [Pimephales promelas]
MALGVDKALSDTSSQMESKSYGCWKTRTPEFFRRGHSKPLSQRVIERTRPANVLGTKDSDTERSGCKKTVTMAPVSRYMTDRSLYTMRKPLTSAQCQIPILKNSSTYEDSEMINYKADSSKEKDKSLAKESFKRITQASPSPYYKSSPALSREDLDTSMNLSDLRLGSCDEDPIFTSSATKRSLSSPLSASLSLTEPPVPKWMSTPRSTSHLSNHMSCFTRKVKNTSEMTDTGRDSLLNTGSSEFYSKNHQRGFEHMSPHQANYWACAIPNSMPPSPNRNSPSWDPEKEYQALLDYTYPLRPNIKGTWGSPDGDLLSQNYPLLQDSGIELDRLCSSSTLSCLDLSHTGTRQRCFSPGTGRKSTEFPALNKSHSKSSDGIMSSSLYSSLDQTGLSIESLDCDGKPEGHYRKFGIFSTFRSAPTFISSTHVLTRPNSQDELDEEFLRLPEHLQELQVLSQQLRDISDQISQPVITSWESLESDITSERSPKVQVGKHEPLMEESGDEDIEARRGSGSEVPLTPEVHLEKAKDPAARIQMISRDVNRRNLREVEAIMDQLSGLSMSELQRTIQTDQDEYETQESLMQHIQVFCSNLEKLIQWLHKVVEKVDFLSPPMVELESVKASLADYKSFQEEVQAHKPLTADVLQTGEMLLHCMNSASPFLKDTLVLIERQSHTLETHSEYLFSSILSAMDSLTDPRSEEAPAIA